MICSHRAAAVVKAAFWVAVRVESGKTTSTSKSWLLWPAAPGNVWLNPGLSTSRIV